MCMGFSANISNFNEDTIKILEYMRDKFSHKYYNTIYFKFDKDFKQNDLELLNKTLSDPRTTIFDKKMFSLSVKNDHDIYEILKVFEHTKIHWIRCNENHFFRKRSEVRCRVNKMKLQVNKVKYG
jgi:hypothetical protein